MPYQGTSRIALDHWSRVPPMPTMHSSCIIPSAEGVEPQQTFVDKDATRLWNSVGYEVYHPRKG